MEVENNDDNQKLVTDYIPKLGIEFDFEQEAYEFYNEKKDGVVTSRKFTCCKGGNKASWERDGENKYERAETRTGCNAHMIIRLDKKKGKYFIQSLEFNHNHILHIPQCAHMMPSQRKVSKAQAMEIDLAYDSDIKLKDSYEFMARQVGGRDALGYTKQDQKNYHYSKRQKEKKCGEAGSLFKYFQKQRKENPSFYCAVQLDASKLITNIFWADAQMIVDYKLFSDVEYRPLAMFVGFNHHRESTIFGAALLYDETIDTFQWLFEAFFEAMSGKKPNTIFTDQDPAMAKAIALVMPNTYHRLCEDEFRSDLDARFKIWEEEEEFLSAWDAILHNTFEVKEKWAKAYVKMSFSIGMTTTQLSENYDIVKLFIHFERLLDAKCYKELKDEYNLRQKLPKVKITSPMLIQAAHIYKPKLFLKFQEQYEEFQGAFVKERVERNATHEYIIVSCSCRKFERIGILFSHALKILDVMDIKVLLEKYILKRWTKDAKNEIVQDFNGRDIKADSKLEVTTRYKFLASECEEAYELALGSYNELSKKIDDILRKNSNPCQVDINQENSSNGMITISAKGLKKKQGCKRRRQIKSCLEKPKKKKKGSIHQPIQTNQCLQVLVSPL
ncbi:hypothetical protein RGQ29_001804 [Quercus rubra]|uniref:Zinc finger PMZ-type domain-containing protein n=1 Tax=Quercus rubra TaxID=3512 RepID=A0AAN7G6U4_QUERU|nr:hypothetical protein RGQ29_001804 [Quercus rubra]